MNEFDDVNQHLEASSAAMAEAAGAILRGHEELVLAVRAARHAQNEHDDLRETVDQLKTLVLDLVRRLNDQKGGQ